MKPGQKANRLIQETSPYLLQHAYNPVDWQAWNNLAWEKAKAESKLVIVSIGYSACHWCHVMEHESFEDPDVAAIMNEFFVSIKVDREERPDIDNIYMEAVQLMTGRGGWPLNCITLPDGRPVYGGTYFPKEGWMNVLQSLNDLYINNPSKVIEYANHMDEGLSQAELVKVNSSSNAKIEFNEDVVIGDFIHGFDTVYGGPKKAPKFPMPCNYDFLLNYGILNNHKQILDQVHLTLTKMAYGGIFDQLGGGFARYSVDELWKVPHFEKMLYDNGQLISLYAKAFAHFKDPLFKRVVEHTLEFLNSELLSANNLYYSALDADSEGVEGKYYVWTEEELKASLTAQEFNFVKEYYSINEYGYWEHNNFVLIRRYDEQTVAQKAGISQHEIEALKRSVDEKLLAVRSKRIKPDLDDKSLLSWNALVLKGLAEAYVFLKDEKFLNNAKQLHKAIHSCFYENKIWYRNFKDGKSTILAFSEDLALIAEANLAMYEMNFEQQYLDFATEITEVVITNFFESKTGMFYFTSVNAEELIMRRTEIFDNVISSPNSVLAQVLYRLGVLLGKIEWEKMAQNLVVKVSQYFENAPQALGNWLTAWLMVFNQQNETVVVGDKFMDAINFQRQGYLPLVIWCGAANEADLPMLTSRLIKGQTTIYKCKNKACNLPEVFRH
jgi:uncharacterized protein YyaL (SSP411 family)